MSEEKGDYKTVPTAEYKWLLEQGAERSILVSTSDPIPSNTTDQPPHVQTYRTYKDTATTLDAELVVTMEHPNKSNPKRIIIDLDSNGPTLRKETFAASVSITTQKSPRVG